MYRPSYTAQRPAGQSSIITDALSLSLGVTRLSLDGEPDPRDTEPMEGVELTDKCLKEARLPQHILEKIMTCSANLPSLSFVGRAVREQTARKVWRHLTNMMLVAKPFYAFLTGLILNEPLMNVLDFAPEHMAISKVHYAIFEIRARCLPEMDPTLPDGQQLIHVPYHHPANRKLLSDMLIKAVVRGFVSIVMTLLENGANVDSHDEHGHSALWLAIESQNMAVYYQIFIHGKANPNSDLALPPLGLAAIRGCWRICADLLRRGADPWRQFRVGLSGNVFSVVQYAATLPDPTLMEILLDHGVNIHSRVSVVRHPMLIAIALDNYTVVELLLNRKICLAYLQVAFVRGRVTCPDRIMALLKEKNVWPKIHESELAAYQPLLRPGCFDDLEHAASNGVHPILKRRAPESGDDEY
ncbi:hypothetical protein FQN57_002547 [Myotisia sp. PD_48]|nr:hypothetical protein FQN57_002547 [Myotisia sp. PD_48]